MEKDKTDINSIKNPVVRIDPSLDKYDTIILFPEKLEKLNKDLLKNGFPGLPQKKSDH